MNGKKRREWERMIEDEKYIKKRMKKRHFDWIWLNERYTEIQSGNRVSGNPALQTPSHTRRANVEWKKRDG